MYKIECIIRPERLEEVQHELEAMGITGLTVTEVRGAGRQAGYVERYRGMEYRVRLIAKVKVEVVIADHLLDAVVEAVQTAGRTGEVGDGKIFISRVEDVVRIRTGDRGASAL
jgi:nitrogen regulatory protein P-II 1